MGKFYKHTPAYGAIGDLQAQYSFAEIVKSMLKDIFGKEVKELAVASESPFYVYDKDGLDVTLLLGSKEVTLTPKQQGAVAVLRYCIKRNITKVTEELQNNARSIFSADFYNLFFIKADWEWGDIYGQLQKARVEKTV